MIELASCFYAADTSPYENLALEELLLSAVKKGEIILYLWQNKNTVVIGRNQNAYRECKVDELSTNGGHLARRLSGGGAVFHDIGNLNFTFLTHKEDYDVNRQLEVILNAVKSFGVSAKMSGRNDLTAGEENGKFSGNAFYKKGEVWYHHGTILINADFQSMARYLTVSPDKLRANGVASVRSRVINLSELSEEISIASMQVALLKAFGEVYNVNPMMLDLERIDLARWDELTSKFTSKQWRLGSEPDSTVTITHRFSWGGIELSFLVSQGIIKNVATYTDSLDTDIPELMQSILENVEFTKLRVVKAFDEFLCSDKEQSNILHDISEQVEAWF